MRRAAAARRAAPPDARHGSPRATPRRKPSRSKTASTVAPADQPVADKPARHCSARKSLRNFDRKNERAAVEKFYTGARLRAASGRRPAS